MQYLFRYEDIATDPWSVLGKLFHRFNRSVPLVREGDIDRDSEGDRDTYRSTFCPSLKFRS